MWNLIFSFFRFQTQENRFWGLGTFLHVCLVSNFIDLFTAWTIFYKLSPMLHNSFSYEPDGQYDTSLFLTSLKTNRNDCKRGIGEIRIMF